MHTQTKHEECVPYYTALTLTTTWRFSRKYIKRFLNILWKTLGYVFIIMLLACMFVGLIQYCKILKREICGRIRVNDISD